MSKVQPQIGFTLVGIKTEQFALIPENYTDQEDIHARSEIEYKFDEENCLLGAFVTFLLLQKDNVFLKISVSCHFLLQKESLNALRSPDGLEYIFPRNFMAHLGAVTVGSARGVLSAKTENTNFNHFIIPLVNVDEIVKDDTHFSITQGSGKENNFGEL